MPQPKTYTQNNAPRSSHIHLIQEIDGVDDEVQRMQRNAVYGQYPKDHGNQASSVTPDLDDGLRHLVTLTGNATINAPSQSDVALVKGDLFKLRIDQDATGGRKPTWNSVYKTGRSAIPLKPNPAASESTVYLFEYDGSANWLLVDRNDSQYPTHEIGTTSGGVIFDFDNGPKQRVILNGAMTSLTIQSSAGTIYDGLGGTIQVQQDVTGTRTVDLGSGYTYSDPADAVDDVTTGNTIMEYYFERYDNTGSGGSDSAWLVLAKTTLPDPGA